MDQQQSQQPQMLPQSGQNRMLMGILAYLGVLVIIPLLVAKDDSFVKFHVKQGLLLAIAEVVIWVLGSMYIWQLWQLMQLAQLAAIVFSIIGIVNVVQGKEKELPLIGSLAHNFKF